MISVFTGCSGDKKGGANEGLIEFDTKALDEKNPLFGFAPSNATLKFKDSKFAIEMSTMGMFNMSIIGDNANKTLAQTIKFMNIRQACIEREKELAEENAEYQLNLEETDEKKEIIGLQCLKVKAYKVNDPAVKFDVWYTKDLGLEDCNALTPYSQLKGVLIDYRIKKFGLEMHFIGKSYKQVSIPDNNFEIPASMKIVSREEMAQFFKDLQ
jgi:hypothetical protein